MPRKSSSSTARGGPRASSTQRVAAGHRRPSNSKPAPGRKTWTCGMKRSLTFWTYASFVPCWIAILVNGIIARRKHAWMYTAPISLSSHETLPQQWLATIGFTATALLSIFMVSPLMKRRLLDVVRASAIVGMEVTGDVAADASTEYQMLGVVDGDYTNLGPGAYGSSCSPLGSESFRSPTLARAVSIGASIAAWVWTVAVSPLILLGSSCRWAGRVTMFISPPTTGSHHGSSNGPRSRGKSPTATYSSSSSRGSARLPSSSRASSPVGRGGTVQLISKTMKRLLKSKNSASSPPGAGGSSAGGSSSHHLYEQPLTTPSRGRSGAQHRDSSTTRQSSRSRSKLQPSSIPIGSSKSFPFKLLQHLDLRYVLLPHRRLREHYRASRGFLLQGVCHDPVVLIKIIITGWRIACLGLAWQSWWPIQANRITTPEWTELEWTTVIHRFGTTPLFAGGYFFIVGLSHLLINLLVPEDGTSRGRGGGGSAVEAAEEGAARGGVKTLACVLCLLVLNVGYVVMLRGGMYIFGEPDKFTFLNLMGIAQYMSVAAFFICGLRLAHI